MHTRIVIAELLVVLLLAVMSGQARADTTQPDDPLATQPDARTIEGAIAKLADGGYQVRQQAMAELIEMGPSVLPAVHRKLAERDLAPETAARLKLVLERLDLIEGFAAGRFQLVSWSGGAAEARGGIRIISIDKTAHAVVARYEWRNGVMVLRQEGCRLVGPWVQDGSVGTFEFTFDKCGQFVSGRWNFSTSPQEWHEAFLR